MNDISNILFPPGSFVRIEGKSDVWEVLYVFQKTESPGKWQYLLCQNSSFRPHLDGKIFYDPIHDFNLLKLNKNELRAFRTFSDEEMLAIVSVALDDVLDS
jgi:hypothetical protein